MKVSKRKVWLLFFSIAILSFIFFYRSAKFRHNETERQNHVREILNHNYPKSPAARFENDPELATYMTEYLEKTGPQLASKEIVKTLLEISDFHQYDPIFLMAIIKTESHFRPGVIGGAGEIGLMQIKPDTAEWTCKKQGVKWKGKESLKDPNYNIQIGALYFKYLKESLKSKAALYIAAYNCGPTQLSRLPASTQQKHPYYLKFLVNYSSIYEDLEKIRLRKKLLAYDIDTIFKDIKNMFDKGGLFSI